MAGSYGTNFDYGDSEYKDGGAAGSFVPTPYLTVPVSVDDERLVSFSLALEEHQGVVGSFSENTGDDCFFTEPGFTGLRVEDDNGIIRHLGFDDRDGLVYEIALRDGPTNSGIVKYWKDKVGIDGAGGTDIKPLALFPADSGTFENYWVRHLISHVFVHAADHKYRDATGYDENGLLDDIEFLLKLYVDGERVTPDRKSKNVPLTGDIHVDHNVEGHIIQVEISADMGCHMIVGRKSDYAVTDRPIGDLVMTEDDYQEEMCQPEMWFSPEPLYTDRANGNELSSAVQALITATSGVTGGSGDAWSFTSALTLPSITLADGTLMFWGQNISSVTIGGSAVTLTAYGTVGSWTLYYANSGAGEIPVTGSGAVVITPSGTGKVFDLRAFNSQISDDAIEYYYDNINDKDGDVVLP